ncbi:MAG TPA: glycogen debranching protein GlgX [Motilibacteraceae bacterium]|nr:glycogen debranching protein GlgX [Motilibacteraceae bacterium]
MDVDDDPPWPGQWAPLGATPTADGTNFALWAPRATAVDLCLFSDDGRPGGGGAEERVRLEESTFGIWHGELPGVGHGQRYGYRVHGPWEPYRSSRWNPDKLLLDPYARAVDGVVVLDDAVFGHRHDLDDTVRDTRDSAPYVPRGVVVDDRYDWGPDERFPQVPWHDTVIYEAHVRGLTMLHPEVPQELRGTYAAVAHPAVVEHLTRLGVTSVELLPVHEFVSEEHLLRGGLTNYWGYNSIGYFAPHGAYSSSGTRGQQVREFKDMVRALHAAGIEVILDVVYNHTAEGNENGYTLSFRGIDNAAYYRVRDGRHYADYTGCGNTLAVRHPHVLQMIMDSLRYWVTEMHVDGFRFDLAAALARSFHDVDMLSSFLTTIAQDPVLSRVKLIAEPWDVGEGGYQVGEFPPLWTEWNDKYRDAVRDHWRGAGAGVRGLASRLSGSSDLYRDDGRRPYASINFVTAHDGFTLTDLVSYDRKHNQANGEGNRDGTDDNRSWNCGVEGPSSDPGVRAFRHRQRKNILATLLLSTGVPMLTSGDELGRTQRGNNNAYCQDNEISWLHWDLSPEDSELLEFARFVLEVRREHQVFRRPHFFEGRPVRAGGRKDLAWFRPDGREMDDESWWDPHLRTLGMFLAGDGIRARGPRGEAITDESFLLLLNGAAHAVDVVLPGTPWASGWSVVLDTAHDERAGTALGVHAPYRMPTRSLALLRAVD